MSLIIRSVPQASCAILRVICWHSARAFHKSTPFRFPELMLANHHATKVTAHHAKICNHLDKMKDTTVNKKFLNELIDEMKDLHEKQDKLIHDFVEKNKE